MGTISSKNQDSSSNGLRDAAGDGVFYVSLKMENPKIAGDLIPHVFGSLPIIGSWDSSKAVID